MLITDESFFAIVQDTWTSTLGFQVNRAEREELAALEALTVGARISGAWDGEVRLHCSPELARLIAAAIFQVDADKAGREEILDALSELIHIVGGNLKPLLPQPVNLWLPSLPDPTHRAQTAPQWQRVCRLTLISEGHPFAVSLLGDPPPTSESATPADLEGRRSAETP
jgi:hypothetical protein